MTENPTTRRSGPEHAAGAWVPAAGTWVPGDGFRELAGIVLKTQNLGEVLTRVAEIARVAIPGADDVSLTLVRRGRARSAAFAGDRRLAALLDQQQYDAGTGPCLDAAASGHTITVEDTSSDTLYPDFARLAHQHGIRQALAVGLHTLQDSTAALNIYSSGDGLTTPHARAVATSFAGYAAVALANATLYAGAVEQVAQMQQAMASRAVIEQAKGIIMSDRRCTAEEAFDDLRYASVQSQRRLRDIAQSIVSGASGS